MFTMDPVGFMEQFEASLSEPNEQETEEEEDDEEETASTPFRHADTLSTDNNTFSFPSL